MMRGSLRFLVVGLMAYGSGCDDETAPNQPVTIDVSRLEDPPDQLVDLAPDCEPAVFDLTGAISDPDRDDPVTIAWLVDFLPGQKQSPDAVNRLRFTFDPCSNSKFVLGQVSTLEAFVLDRAVPLDVLADADLLKAFAGDGVTTAKVEWRIRADTCNAARPECGD